MLMGLLDWSTETDACVILPGTNCPGATQSPFKFPIHLKNTRNNFQRRSHWPSGHMIRSRSLIGQSPPFLKYLNLKKENN